MLRIYGFDKFELGFKEDLCAVILDMVVVEVKVSQKPAGYCYGLQDCLGTLGKLQAVN